VVTVPARPRTHGGGVAAGLRLGQGVREHGVTGGERGEVALLQILGRRQQQWYGTELVDRGDQRRRRAGPCDLLDDDHGRQRVGARSAVGLGYVHGVQVGLDQRGVDVVRELAGLVDLACPGCDLGVGQGADRLP
jgi:hypothetical protein